jgi:hypothetical protein
MRKEIKSLVENIKTTSLKYETSKNKEVKKELEFLIDELLRDIDTENSEENTYIVSNLLPITTKHFEGFGLSRLYFTEKPLPKLDKSVWSILIKNKLVKYTNTKSLEYYISPYSEGLEKIFKKIVGDDDLRPLMQSIEFKDGNTTGTDAHKLLHIVGDNSNKNNFKKDGLFLLYSEIEKTYNNLKNKDSIDISLKEYYEKVGEIYGNYPNWYRILPNDYSFYKKFDLKYLNGVLVTLLKNKILNQATNIFAFEFDTKDGKYHIGFNAEILSELLQSMIMAGENVVNFYFNLPSQGVVILNHNLKYPSSKQVNKFFKENNFGICMPMNLYLHEDSLEEDLMVYPTIKYNDEYDFDIRIGNAPSYNLIQLENKSNKQ